MDKDRGCIRVRLHEIRARFNLSQEDLTKMLGNRGQTIIVIEKGEYYPLLLSTLKTAKKLSLRVEDIFEYAEKYGDVK